MRRLFFLLNIVLLFSVAANAQTKAQLEAVLNRLDSVIDEAPKYERAKQMRITKLIDRLKGVKDPLSRYNINMRIYDEYESYKSDSAISYLEDNVRLARYMQRKDLEGDCLSLLAFQSSTVGRYYDALAILSKVDVTKLHGDGVFHYFRAENHVYNEIGYYSKIKSSQDSAYAISGKYEALMLKVLNKKSADYKQYLCRSLFYSDRRKEAEKVCNEWLKMEPETSRNFAIAAYYKYLIDVNNSEYDKAMYWAAKSAICDIQHAVMDQGSLWSIADYISGRDIDRSYKYIKFAWQCAMTFGTLVRAAQISPVLNVIESEYKDTLDKANLRLTIVLSVIAVMAIVLLVILIYIQKQRKRLAEAKNSLKQRNEELATTNDKLEDINKRLADSNGKLKDANSRIKAVNGQLHESDQIKEAYIGRFLALCSYYVDRMDMVRKDAVKMIKAHKLDELVHKLRSTEQKEQDVEELYSYFDSTFLNIFPTFVEDFNALLKPEARIEATEGKLNTTLRIFALIRLGIDDSGKIADFLHYSVNTIYNYRARTKNGCAGNRDTFEDEVKMLGKI